VRALCDRRFGVGADGVLAILPPRVAGAHARMRVLNADGSEPEMCGNGLRCVVKYLHETSPELRLETLLVDTDAGVLSCLVEAGSDHLVRAVTVNMGAPRLERAQIPMTGPGQERCVDVALPVAGRSIDITAVSMGNPHAIHFTAASGSELQQLAETLGPQVEHHDWFPRRTNAEFARVHGPGEIELVVWERGCGITLACGTGACATAVAACLTGQARPEEPLRLRLPGGELTITVARDLSHVLMRGPASHVFDATVDLAQLAARG
jgi:diaminopimelate epimerase